MSKAEILIVEDDKDIAELVEYNLTREGYHVASVGNGEDALNYFRKESPHLVILDVMLPGMDGLDICKLMKQEHKTKAIPIIMLTAKSEESDVIVGLQLGADDYVTKPFSPKVLVARVKAVLRRQALKHSPKEVRTIEGLMMDIPKHKVLYNEKMMDVTSIEFNILEFLSRYPGRAFTRDQIMDSAWKEGKFVIDRAVDVHVRSLRKKLGKGSRLIETVRGVGYRFKESEEADE